MDRETLVHNLDKSKRHIICGNTDLTETQQPRRSTKLPVSTTSYRKEEQQTTAHRQP
jgi:hypothetical protein